MKHIINKRKVYNYLLDFSQDTFKKYNINVRESEIKEKVEEFCKEILSNLIKIEFFKSTIRIYYFSNSYTHFFDFPINILNY